MEESQNTAFLLGTLVSQSKTQSEMLVEIKTRVEQFDSRIGSLETSKAKVSGGWWATATLAGVITGVAELAHAFLHR